MPHDPDSHTNERTFPQKQIQGGMAVTLKLRPRHDGLRKLWEFLLPVEVRTHDEDATINYRSPHKHPAPTDNPTPIPYFPPRPQDTLLLEASLPPAATPPLILALARRLHHRSLHLTTPDLFRYSSLQPDDATKGLGLDPARFVVYTDAPAGAQQLLRGGGGGAGVVDAVVKHRDMFQLVHVTDQNASPVVYVCVWLFFKSVGDMRTPAPPIDQAARSHT